MAGWEQATAKRRCVSDGEPLPVLWGFWPFGGRLPHAARHQGRGRWEQRPDPVSCSRDVVADAVLDTADGELIKFPGSTRGERTQSAA